AVQKIYEREADSGSKKSVHCMEHRIPEREHQVKLADLPEDLRRKDKEQDNDLQRGGQLHLERHLHKARDHKEQQGQRTKEHVLIIAVQKLEHHHHDHKEPQDKIDDK